MRTIDLTHTKNACPYAVLKLLISRAFSCSLILFMYLPQALFRITLLILVGEKENMPLFLAVHRWKLEEQLAVTKEAAALFTAIAEGKLPGGIELCATYMSGGGAIQAVCVWKASNKEALGKVLDQAPVMKKTTEIIPVVQSYPSTVEYTISLWKQMTQAPSK